MNISQIKQSKFLARADVNPPILVIIRSIEQSNVAKENEPPEMKYTLTFSNCAKPMVLNNTNAQIIAMILKSEETDDWIGKQIVLYDDPNVSFGGKLVGGIRVRAPRVKGTTKPAPVVQPEPEPEPEAEIDDPPFLTHAQKVKQVQDILDSTKAVIEKESAKSRMKLLNTLKAAPGQEKRAMITHYLMVKKWISHPQTPDDWPVSKMPRNDMELMKLATDIDEFQQRQQREHPEIVP